MNESYTLSVLLDMTPSRLLEVIEDSPLHCRKFLASYYPNAQVRRACLKSLGVIFADDSSYANMGFVVIPNSPSDVHVYIGKNVSIAPNVVCVCESSANNGDAINQFPYVADRLTKKATYASVMKFGLALMLQFFQVLPSENAP